MLMLFLSKYLIQSWSFFFFLNAGVVVDSTRLSVSSSSLTDGSDEVFFSVTMNSQDQSADAALENMWQMSAYLASTSDGTGKRVVLGEEILTPRESSQALFSGSRTGFYDMRTRVNRDTLDCTASNYLCIEVTRAPNAPNTFSFTGSQANSLSSCERLECAKKRKWCLGVVWHQKREPDPGPS